MTLKDNVTNRMKVAMRSKNKVELSTYRSILSAIINNEKNINTNNYVNDVDILTTLAKQRKQSIDQFTIGGKIEAAEEETAELKIIESLLPKQMSDDELKTNVLEIINSLDGDISIKQLGVIIKEFKSKYSGQDMSKVAKIAKGEIIK